MVVHFVDFDGIADPHGLSFLFIITVGEENLDSYSYNKLADQAPGCLRRCQDLYNCGKYRSALVY